MAKVLVVDDEKELAEVLQQYLLVEGFDTKAAFDGEEGICLFHSFQPDLAVLDIMLPGKNGFEVLKEIRKTSNIPVIMLSAKNGEMDKVISLGSGADDYVTKPFSPLELIARVKAQYRRYESVKAPQNNQNGSDTGGITLNTDSYEAWFDGTKEDLSTKEFELLRFLMENVNHVYSKEQLYENIWGMNQYGDIGTVAVYIKKLRKRMEAHEMDYIKTVWGVGYKFVVPVRE